MRRVEGKIEPTPKGEIASRKIIPPRIPSEKKGFFSIKKSPTRSCPRAIKPMKSDG
jgi:hypothetical protein